MRTNKLILIIVLILSFLYPSIGAENNRLFIDKQQWSKFSKNYDYTENYKVLKKKNKKKSAPFFSNFNSFFSKASWIKYLLGALVILILLTLIVLLLLNLWKGIGERVSRNVKVQQISVIEDIESVDLESMFSKAIGAGLFKEAIRIRYLMLIKSLSNFRLVIWKKDKTNGNYVSEMAGKKGSELFRHLTISFERVWYGEKEINEADYLKLIPLFDQMSKIIISREA